MKYLLASKFNLKICSTFWLSIFNSSQGLKSNSNMTKRTYGLNACETKHSNYNSKKKSDFEEDKMGSNLNLYNYQNKKLSNLYVNNLESSPTSIDSKNKHKNSDIKYYITNKNSSNINKEKLENSSIFNKKLLSFKSRLKNLKFETIPKNDNLKIYNLYSKKTNSSNPCLNIEKDINYGRYPVIHNPKSSLSKITSDDKKLNPIELTDSNHSSNFKIENYNQVIPLNKSHHKFVSKLFEGYSNSFFSLDNVEIDNDGKYSKETLRNDIKCLTSKNILSILSIIFLIFGIISLFILSPVLTFLYINNNSGDLGNLSEYTYPILSSIRTNLIDPDTPNEFLTKKTRLGKTWNLVFSDEFNVNGRTFYEGDDQFFTAVDLHYAATNDLEWYDPDAIITFNGSLIIRMDAYKNHDLFYRSGMIQSWNKICFTQGLIEFSVMLPHYGNNSGLWPGLWTLGNLARPGYMATSEGVWPYSYNSCDVGITANQSSFDGISFLPGQRLNSCTCVGEDHPNMGTGRGAPEIDILEGSVSPPYPVASQSYQLAPFDIWYMPDYNFIEIYNKSISSMNTYTGGPFQEAVSVVTILNNSWYERNDGDNFYQKFSIEYLNDDENGYITWYVGNTPTHTVYSKSFAPNGNIGWRRISKEPMSIIINFAISNSWTYVDWPSLTFPSHMKIDYVRIYQPNDSKSVTCDPLDYPTNEYIQLHLNIYQNPNLTTFSQGGYKFPKNKLTHNC